MVGCCILCFCVLVPLCCCSHDVTFGAIDSSSSVNVPCTFVLLLSESIAAPSSVAHEVLEATKMQGNGATFVVLQPDRPQYRHIVTLIRLQDVVGLL